MENTNKITVLDGKIETAAQISEDILNAAKADENENSILNAFVDGAKENDVESGKNIVLNAYTAAIEALNTIILNVDNVSPRIISKIAVYRKELAKQAEQIKNSNRGN